MDTRGAVDLQRLQGSYPIPTTKRELQRRHAALRDGEPFIGLTKRGLPIPSIRGSMDYYLVTPIPPFNSGTGAAFATFTTLKDVSPTPLPNILGNQLRAGSGILIEANGEYSTAVSAPTLQLAVIYGAVAGAAGGVNLAASAAITAASSAAAFPWILYYTGVVTATGTAGSITGQGYLLLGTSLTAMSVNPMPVTAAARTVAIDTTVAKLIGIGAAWGTSSASNSIKVYNVAALLLN